MSQKPVIVVPARLQSQRFPRKLLTEIRGKPLILWTAERVQEIAPDFSLYFAIADDELDQVLRSGGFRTVMTDPALPSGTDRLAQANREIGADAIINVQADEPLVDREHVQLLQSALEKGADMATLATPFSDFQDFQDSNKVKVVRDTEGFAAYFSRAPIPFERDHPDQLPEAGALWHLGLYAYTAKLLEAFVAWKPTPLECSERLEQLRALENGARISVGVTSKRTVGIDTPEDVTHFSKALEASSR